MEHIESRTADTILQKSIRIEVGENTYDVAPPSIATLVMVSQEISTLPSGVRLDEDHLIESSLAAAKDCRSIGSVAAVLILGAKGCKTRKRHVPRRKEIALLGGLLHFHRTVLVEEEYDPKEELSNEIMEELTPREMQNLIARILQQMQIGDFFGLTTFLSEVNLTRQTKVD